jgi:endonuclease/exonuclease/phosphatase family metal-dependent hydrolase
MRTLINWIVFPFTLVVAALLLISGQSPLVSPQTSTWIALLGLGFPVLFLLNALLLIYWGVQLKWRTLIPLAILLLNLGQASLYIQFNQQYSESEPDSLQGVGTIEKTVSLKVLTYNAGLFGYFQDQWNLDTVCHRINKENPDIVCFQEVYSNLGSMAVLEQIMQKKLNLNYGQYHLLNANRPYGMIILSKYPIKKWMPVRFEGKTGNTAMWADIQVSKSVGDMVFKQKFRIFNIHLQSFKFGKQDYSYIENQGQNDAGKLDIDGSKGIVYRLRKGYEKRATQVARLLEEFEKTEIPKIVCGDMNDVPVSYSYRQLSKGMKDAFVESGFGLEATYQGPFPSFRIDYLLCDGRFDVTQYESWSEVPSDHKLVGATFRWVFDK